jgi:tRNA(Ser,Leu) C12 N-acetylase TAN1
MAEDIRNEIAKLIVTSAGLETSRHTRSALKAAIPTARIRRTGLKGIFSLEAEGDVFELAKLICRDCQQRIGHVTAVLAEVESRFDPIKETAVRIGREQIGPEESFCFRLHKRGAHYLEQDTLTIEQEIGGDIWTALEEKHGAQPSVKLKNPDVAIVAEVLGPLTAVGVFRRAWREHLAAA